MHSSPFGGLLTLVAAIIFLIYTVNVFSAIFMMDHFNLDSTVRTLETLLLVQN